MNLKAINLDEMDQQDPLGHLQAQFTLPPGQIYLDGNSLGPPPDCVAAHVAQLVSEQWGKDGIQSWNKHSWIDLPARVGAQIAPLLGAQPNQVIACDSTSINLFKLLCGALSLRPQRKDILCVTGDFPTDHYMAQGLANWLGGDRARLRTVAADQLGQALNEQTAVLLLTQVDFRSGYRHDIQQITAAAHREGALVLWDLSHSTGVMPLQLDQWQVDLATGCGYKYLNGGPGAPAYVYVAAKHQHALQQPLQGWMGHADPFAFNPDYQPAQGVLNMQCGTPGILSMAALASALSVFDGLDLGKVRAKSEALIETFIGLVGAEPALSPLVFASPAQAAERGSHIVYRHEHAYAIAQALIDRDVIVDFRAPDLLRFGFSPPYLRYADIGVAVDRLTDIMRTESYLQPHFQERGRVT